MNKQQLKQTIDDNITTNGQNKITGAKLNDVLNEMVDSLGVVDQISVGTTTTGAAGTDASVTNSGTATDPVLNFTIPRGADGQDGANAVNPFKGWFTTANIPTTGQEGDYCNVTNTQTQTVTIYRWSTAQNAFVDTGEVPDTATGETFASGETLQEVAIDDSHLVDPVNTADPTHPVLAQAEDAMQLKSALRCSTLVEKKAEFVLGNGYINYSGAVSGSTTNAHAEIVILSGYNSIRFLGLMTYPGANSFNYCFVFYDSNDVAIKAIRYLVKPDSPDVRNEYIVDIPEGATKFKCSIDNANRTSFYCYFRKGESVGDNIESVADGIHDEFYDITQVTNVVVNPDVPAGTNYKSIQNAAIGGNITDYYVNSTSQKIMRYGVEGGRQYLLSGYWRISFNYTVASWTDENGVILKVELFNGNDLATLALALDDYKLTAPDGARYLYVLNRTSTYLTNPILKEWRVKDFLTRRRVRVLCIGNSYSQDALAYLPFLWTKVVDDIDLTVGILYEDGASLSDHWNNWQNNANAYTLFVSENGKAWTSRSSSSIKYALDNFGWDIILTHQKSSDSYYPSNAYESNHQPYLNNLINAIQAYVSRPLKFGWMLIQARPAQASGNNYTETQMATNFANIVANAQKVFGQTLCEFVIPWGTAIQNARTLQDICVLGNYVNNTNNNSGKGYLTYDGVHLQEGLPCQVAAYTVLLSLLGLVGEDCRSIVGDDTVTDTSWLAGKNIPGANPSAGTPVGATLENARKAQKCAVMARKSPYEVTDMNYIVNPV